MGASRLCSISKPWVAITLSAPDLKTWSTVLSQSCRSETLVEEHLVQFKNGISLKKHSLGFMFACCARIKKKQAETDIFKKVFPKVPIFGLYGDGEYGLNTLIKSELLSGVLFIYLT